MSTNIRNDDEIVSSNISGHQRLTQKRLAEERTKLFKDILRENGVILSRTDRSHILTKEQSLVIRDIEKALNKNDQDRDENVEKFLTGFKTCCKKDGFLHSSLLSTVLRKDAIDDSNDDSYLNAIHQESLIRILFQVSSIQNEIIEFILDEATEQLSEENSDSPNFRLILNAMKYLPFIETADTVTQKLLDMVEIATLDYQLEILNSIADIIPDSQNESTAKQLSKMLENNTELTSAIIDCLNSLNLASNTRIEIQQFIIQRLLSSVSIDVYPVFFDFLTSDCKPINLPGILLKCRDALNDIMRNEKVDDERESKKVVIMKKLHMSVASKVQYDGWMNLLINMNNFRTGHKPIDVIILAMLHSTGTNRKREVEALIKRHVKHNLLKKQHIETVFEKYFTKQILRDYFTSIVEIAGSLLKNAADQLSTEFASAIFVLLFEDENIDRIQRQDILHALILLTSVWETKNIGDVLKILLELSKGKQLKHHVLLLMGLLEKVDSFELKDVKQVFELLCSMTCNNSDELNSGLKDELHILIRKQISSAKRHLKQRGVIAAIVMAKHIAATSEPQGDLDDDDSLSDLANLPNGPPQESASLLELARNAASSIPELMGLYYDQLASMLVRAPNLDKSFMKWLRDNVQEEFESTYTSNDGRKLIDDIPIYSQFCLNEEREVDESISVNIAGLTMRPIRSNQIALLAPLFRMFRMLCVKSQGHLEEIDALLGCGVILPELDDLSLYDKQQIKMVADSLFHCVNWFRETVSAFVNHSYRMVRSKLINRIKHLVRLEETLMKCLEQIPEHKLPSSYFYNVLTSVVKGSPIKTKAPTKINRARKKMKTNAGEAVDFLNETIASTSFVPTQKKKTTSSGWKRGVQQPPKPDFRELDTDLIIILKYSLNFTDTTTETTIYISVFRYVLADIVTKLGLIVGNKNLGMSNLNEINPANLIADCVKFAPRIFANFKEISAEIGKLFDRAERQDDHVDLYTGDANMLKTSFCLCLEYFMLLFSWKGFVNNHGLLRDCLKALIEEETSSQSIMFYSRHVANKFVLTADQCLHLQPAVFLIKVIEALYNINAENTEIKKKIAAVSGKFLNKKWYNTRGDLDNGKNTNENLDVLIKAYLDGANIKTISGIVSTLQKQISTLQRKEDHLEMLESINKSNFHIFYRNLCHFTLERVKIEVASLTNKQHLILWRTTAILMQGLVDIAKDQDAKANYIAFLQKSNGILKVFLSHGVPILEIMLKSKTDEVVEIFKTLQTTTRFLHHLCCTSKLVKDGSIVAHIPKFKVTLETLIYRVKAALVANDCTEAFWMGNLKNKNLDGQEILTQSSTTTDVESEIAEVEEELPAEDSDEDILGQYEELPGRNNNEEKSASEIYD